MSVFPNALSEINIGGVTLPNRIVRAAHTTMLGLDDESGISERYIDYHEARARGGAGLTILEVCSGHASCFAPLMATNPALIEGYQRLVERIKPYGMRLFQQMWHGGHHAEPVDGSVPWSASDVPSPHLGVMPRPMTKTMIDEVVEGFVLMARTAKQGGLDGVEVHAAHGYLPMQFLSPLTNRRDDEYGGSFENRMRFMVEVLTSVRNEVGAGFPVGIRIGPELYDGGFTVEDCIQVVQALENQGLTDFVDITQGSYFNEPPIIAPMHEPSGYQLPCSVPIADAAQTPTIVTGRFRTMEEAEQVIRLGQADCVSMVRATIADPDLVRKSVEGKIEEVRPCLGCNQACLGRMVPGKYELGMSCTVNPAVGLEAQLNEVVAQPGDEPKHVLVIGGGPSGMEAARVAALRGHKVTLCEANKDLGGKLRLAEKAPNRLGIGDIAHWLESEIYRLGVDVLLNTYLDESDIDLYEPDAVVCATGTWPCYDGFHLGNPGHPFSGSIEAPLSSLDIFAQTPKAEDGPYVIEDDIGHYEGIATAEYLLQTGAEVIYVTRHPAFAPLMEATYSAEPALERLCAQEKFRLFTSATVSKIDARSVEINSAHATHTKVEARSVVLVAHDAPSYGLFESIEAMGIETHIVGDAKSPRFLETAILEGRLAGMAL